MSWLSTLPPTAERSGSALSNISATTYHSFQDLDVYEPGQSGTPYQDHDAPGPKEDRSKPVPEIIGNVKREEMKLRRRDSGYESLPSRSRSRASRPPKEHRISSASIPCAQAKSRSSRPSMRRAARSNPSPRTVQATGTSLYVVHPQPRTDTYFHFPALEAFPGAHDDEAEEAVEQSYPPPPPTTHYWTSDHTRRLEYAAIDAASRGVKGWFLKHVVPDCFVPKDNRRVGFDDDTGSVRRYRLELDSEELDEKSTKGGKKMGWLFGR